MSSIGPLSTGRALMRLGGNTARLARNAGGNLLQNHAVLKDNSLILSSFMLVMSRILVANYSAMKTKGTPDATLRHKEAIRTNIREVCGWTFGFIVLRWFQNLIKKGLKKRYQIDTGIPNHWIRREFNTIWHAFQNKTNYKTGGPPALSAAGDVFRPLKSKAAYEQDTLLRLLKKLPFKSLKNAAAKDLVKPLYSWAPIIVGSIPAVFLAGYALERFTRDYSDKVVDAVSRKFGSKHPSEKNIRSKSSLQEQDLSLASVRFNHFADRIHQLQAERGIVSGN